MRVPNGVYKGIFPCDDLYLIKALIHFLYVNNNI